MECQSGSKEGEASVPDSVKHPIHPNAGYGNIQPNRKRDAGNRDVFLKLASESPIESASRQKRHRGRQQRV